MTSDNNIINFKKKKALDSELYLEDDDIGDEELQDVVDQFIDEVVGDMAMTVYHEEIANDIRDHFDVDFSMDEDYWDLDYDPEDF